MKPSKDGNHYEYIAVYVDDLAICMKDPQAFCDTVEEKYTLKLKELDPSVTILDVDIPEMKMEPLLLIEKNMLKKSLSHMKKMLGSKPKKTRTPLMAGDRPKMTYLNFVIKTKSNNIKQLLDC